MNLHLQQPEQIPSHNSTVGGMWYVCTELADDTYNYKYLRRTGELKDTACDFTTKGQHSINLETSGYWNTETEALEAIAKYYESN